MQTRNHHFYLEKYETDDMASGQSNLNPYFVLANDDDGLGFLQIINQQLDDGRGDFNKAVHQIMDILGEIHT